MGTKKFDEKVPAASQSADAVDLKSIDPDDATFRLSYGFDLEPLKESIRRIGLINPPLLRKRPDGRYQIVSGYRRIRALRGNWAFILRIAKWFPRKQAMKHACS